MDGYQEEELNLIRGMIRASNPQAITDWGCRLLGNPIFFHAVSNSIPYYTKQIYVEHPLWQELIVSGKFSTQVLSAPDSNPQKHIEDYNLERRPLLVDGYEGTYQNLIIPISVNRSNMGMLICTNYMKSFSKRDWDLFQLVGDFFTEKLKREIMFIQRNGQLTEGVFLRLLEGIKVEREVVTLRMKQLSWHPKEYLYLIVFQKDEMSWKTDLELHALIEVLTADKQNRLLKYCGELIYIVSSAKRISDPEQYFCNLVPILESCGTVAGISHSFQDIMEIHRYYNQVKQILKLGRKLKTESRILQFDAAFPFLLIEQWEKDEDIEDLCGDEIRVLVNYDQENGTELVKTLSTYFECGLDIKLTSERMVLHRNTILYRINRCRELLNSDFTNLNEIFGLILSFKVLEYQCQRRNEIVRKRRRNFVVFRRGEW